MQAQTIGKQANACRRLTSRYQSKRCPCTLSLRYSIGALLWNHLLALVPGVSRLAFRLLSKASKMVEESQEPLLFDYRRAFDKDLQRIKFAGRDYDSLLLRCLENDSRSTARSLAVNGVRLESTNSEKRSV